MKAAVIQKKGVICIDEVPEPVTGPYDAICEILTASICSGTDNHILRDDPYHKVQFPCILGHESIGRVLSVGEKVRNLVPGDVVTRPFNRMPEGSDIGVKYGAFAERGFVTDWKAMEEDGVDPNIWKPFTVHRKIPSTIDPIYAVMIITWRETLAFLNRLPLKANSTIIVIGSGANALAFTEHLHNLGHNPIAVGSSDRLEDFLNAGAKEAFSYKDEHLTEKITAKFSHIDCIIDAVGTSKTSNETLQLLTDGGIFALYGLDGFHSYELNITAAKGDVKYFNGEHYDEGSAHDAVIEYIHDNKLDASRYISRQHIYQLTEVEKALDAAKARKAYKPVLQISPENDMKSTFGANPNVG